MYYIQPKFHYRCLNILKGTEGREAESASLSLKRIEKRSKINLDAIFLSPLLTQ